MGRHGYSDDYDDNWTHICWRGQVKSAIKGKRGQAFLKELISALEAMPEKKLIAGELEENGQVCALGSVGKARGIDMSNLDVHDHEMLAEKFGIAHQMIREIEWENDENGGCGPHELSIEERRWHWIHKWAKANLKEEHQQPKARGMSGR